MACAILNDDIDGGRMIDTGQVMNEVMADNVVENIAQMNQEQRNLFVDTFVKKWPRLASQVSLNIESTLQESLLSHQDLREVIYDNKG